MNDKAIRGVLWSAMERFSIQGCQFVIGLVIARFVMPEEFGLIAMTYIFMLVAQLFVDSGFGNALIQKKRRTAIDYSTVFYFNIIISLLLYLILFVTAPLIGDFYHQPLLCEITRWIGLDIILSAFTIVQRSKLTIELNFKLLAKVSLLAVLISGIVGIAMAYNGYGVWALVTQTLLNSFILCICLWCVAKWQPIWAFSTDSFKQMFSFGSKLLAAQLLHTIYLNLYSLVIGRWYNAVDTGYYNRAYTIAQRPITSITQIFTRVLYPLQCEHQDDDKRLSREYLRFLRVIYYVIFPLSICMAILAKPLLLVILTEKWVNCAPLVSILCIGYMWIPISILNGGILQVKGRSDLFLKIEFFKKFIAVAILFATIPLGLRWLCWGIVAYNVIDGCIIVFFTRTITSVGYIRLIQNLMPILMLALVCGVASWMCVLYIQIPLLQLLIGFLAGGLTLITGSFVLKFDEINLVKSLFHKTKA